MLTWPYAPLRDVIAAAAIAERLNVSEVARSSRGFVKVYESLRRPAMVERAVDTFSGQTWSRRRYGFIARTLPAYDASPSERRRIALLCWAFDPNMPRRQKIVV
jgi:hypothetical protein